MKIRPRKQSDRGGYLMMPLVENVPVPANKTWEKVRCPRCGEECWDRALPDGFSEDMFDGKLCTICGLKIKI